MNEIPSNDVFRKKYVHIYTRNRAGPFSFCKFHTVTFGVYYSMSLKNKKCRYRYNDRGSHKNYKIICNITRSRFNMDKHRFR
ncbi:hypothetical protein NY2A_b827R [Paramecium bursaria Chlorella virus NY2A]|uniref:Uncharacterized protein b827R n=1 Tax=Paramecium bursaria Chlorella virus NY2A TaxID=46021 RepID=A7IY02_PBCVN|nr:hypothetical protein NY2A_b827R [Paramecium bursaria Chlorella virus NY2A]ABT15226.1 hypothetical protein NY2A_b827R [Paramecium bursaria Chlorella virus NY2A]